jgi:hypothetical protein
MKGRILPVSVNQNVGVECDHSRSGSLIVTECAEIIP